MSITKSIGKNTLGGGKKMTTSLRRYNRSTHDLSRSWRSTMAPGPLTPNFVEIGLPGDTWELDLRTHILTHPTVGPLFGSYKFQNDFFLCPIRLYNALLHNNALNIGLDIKKVKLPQIVKTITADAGTSYINPSCLLAYLGLRSFGGVSQISGTGEGLTRHECTPLIAYYDIFKNYYSNKQEEKWYTIGGIETLDGNNTLNYIAYFNNPSSNNYTQSLIGLQSTANNKYPYLAINKDVVDENGAENIILFWDYNNTKRKQYNSKLLSSYDEVSIKDLPSEITRGNYRYFLYNPNKNPNDTTFYIETIGINGKIKLNQWNLTDIDDCRDEILSMKGEQVEVKTGGTLPDYLNQFTELTISKSIKKDGILRAPAQESVGLKQTAAPMFGLALKTYQSDLFNNWVNTEWIEGENGINAITAIDTSDGNFTLDTLNLSKKVYDMLNRIAISGGTYQDWVETVYTSNYVERCETPVYIGGYSSEIEFQEVISNSATNDEPLGTLAGRGVQTSHKGGKIKIKIEEPCYIIGIASITPRVDYCQGNKFFTQFETLDDFHKPALDGIGFQDLNTFQMVGETERWNGTQRTNYAIGKQPAWLNYMTAVNENYGNFAIRDNEAFMCLNRWYDSSDGGIILSKYDWSTYINPSKYNQIFADTDLSAQNFWVQCGIGVKCRRVMSAKIIPNL